MDGSNLSRGNSYAKTDVIVTEIRDRSVFFKCNGKAPGREMSMGRSLLHAASDDLLTKYKGPLPAKMGLRIVEWWVDKYSDQLDS